MIEKYQQFGMDSQSARSHINQLRALYFKVGVGADGADKRIEQALHLANVNQNASLRLMPTGFGIGCDMQVNMWNGGHKYTPVVIASDNREAVALEQALIRDADTPMFNPPSSGVPLPLRTVWTNTFFEQIYKKTTYAQLTTPFQQGTWGTVEMKLPIIGRNGTVAPYNDFTGNGNSEFNLTYNTRKVGYFETTINYGEMQSAQFAMAKLDYIGQVRSSRELTISQFTNDLMFSGYAPSANTPLIEGIINNSQLNPAISLPADGRVPGTQTLTTAWSGKDYSQIIRDVQLLVSQVITQGVGNVSTNSPFVLALPQSAATYLQTSTIFGVTVAEQLKKTYPQMEIVIVPNFEQALTGYQNTMMMVLFKDPDTGNMPYLDAFTTKRMGHRPQVALSSIAEKVSMGLAGAILTYPLYVSFALGV